MLHILLLSLLSALLINLVLFLVAFKLQSDKLTDISYAISFITLDIIALIYAKKINAYSIVLFFLVLLWGLRIGSFLLYRVLKIGKDQRFDDLRSSFTKFGKFWLGQAVTAWILMLPVTIAQHNGGNIKILEFIGFIIWAIGLIVEALADIQKLNFKLNLNNKGKWIDQGVWKLSRHPNYFGEISIWIGIYLYCFNALTSAQKIIAILSPLSITLVLLFISGVPILEKSADKKWGDNKEYINYKNKTRLLIPLPKVK